MNHAPSLAEKAFSQKLAASDELFHNTLQLMEQYYLLPACYDAIFDKLEKGQDSAAFNDLIDMTFASGEWEEFIEEQKNLHEDMIKDAMENKVDIDEMLAQQEEIAPREHHIRCNCNTLFKTLSSLCVSFGNLCGAPNHLMRDMRTLQILSHCANALHDIRAIIMQLNTTCDNAAAAAHAKRVKKCLLLIEPILSDITSELRDSDDKELLAPVIKDAHTAADNLIDDLRAATSF